jgi:hypothetical protein
MNWSEASPPRLARTRESNRKGKVGARLEAARTVICGGRVGRRRDHRPLYCPSSVVRPLEVSLFAEVG